MSRGISVLALILGLGMAQASIAENWAVPAGQWYFSPMVGMNFEDKARDSNPGIAASLGLGKQLSDSWAAELSLFGGKNDGYNEFRPVGVGVDFLLNIGDAGLISPYLVLGTGFLRGDVVEGPIINRELNYDSAIGTAGFGVIAPLGNAATRLRAEVRYRHDFNTPSYNDVLTMVGIYVPLGDKPARRGGRTTAPSAGDRDRDGVEDDVDVCPNTTANTPVDVFGCELDTDKDGIPNVTDDCPDTPRGTRVNTRGCGRSADTDQDGVADSIDRCPGTPRSAAVDSAGCEVDDDGDGVVNSLDSCPNTTAGARIDIRGCEVNRTIKLPGVRFELSSSKLISTTTATLDEAAATLRANPGMKVEAAGYTDTSGPAELNLKLSQQRAEAVRRYLISKGAKAANITARGYGEANPIADNSIRSGRQQNRRVELRILN